MSLSVAAWGLIASAAAGDQIPVKADGVVHAVVVDCRACPGSGSKKACSGGMTAGFDGEQRCGNCLIEANYKAPLRYPFDLMLQGRLVDEKGKPVGGKFVRLYMSTTWRVRTRTREDGTFRMRLGATAPRKGGEPVTVDLGDRLFGKDGSGDEYALYMLPPEYRPCPAEGGKGQ